MVAPVSKKHVARAWPVETEPDCSTLTLEQSIAIWRDLMDAGEAIVLATLREEAGPNVDIEDSYRRWYEGHMAQRDRELYGIETLTTGG